MNNFQIKMLQKLADRPELLNSWEQEFVESLLDRNEDYVLSDKQNAILNRLSEKL